MQRTDVNSSTFHWANLHRLAVAAIFLTACFSIRSMAQQPGQKTFLSAEEAGNALVAATKNNDEKAMVEILGRDGKQIVSSGDEAEDAQSRATFVERYQQMHRLVTEPDRTTTLYIGAENWPTPIPLVNKNNSWYFDTNAGKREILFRRIGQNEAAAISVCEELVAAQKEYHGTHDNEYAQKLLSDEGQHNGLYWKAADGEAQSPIGPLVASAVTDDYAESQAGSSTPYRGYYFRILARQKKTTSSGAKSYAVNSKMTGGFAFVAFPAEYRSSGVMTFIVDEDGVVYEKDLGKKTDVLARTMKGYNLNSNWQEADDQRQETADTQKTE
jgi:hypothetical protein